MMKALSVSYNASWSRNFLALGIYRWAIYFIDMDLSSNILEHNPFFPQEHKNSLSQKCRSVEFFSQLYLEISEPCDMLMSERFDRMHQVLNKSVILTQKTLSEISLGAS